MIYASVRNDATSIALLADKNFTPPTSAYVLTVWRVEEQGSDFLSNGELQDWLPKQSILCVENPLDAVRNFVYGNYGDVDDDIEFI